MAESFMTANRSQSMKKFLLWSFERGSRPYDAICLAILAFIFLTPPSFFNDRPDFMRVDQKEPVSRYQDNNGNTVYTVQVSTPAFTPAAAVEKAAEDRLREVIHEKFEITKAIPV